MREIPPSVQISGPFLLPSPMANPKLSWFGSSDNNVKVGKLVLQREEEGMG
jgi:hypothetical protein